MGVEMITICIVLSTIAKSIELFIVFIRVMYQLFKYKKMERPEFDYDASYGFKVAMVVLALIWGARKYLFNVPIRFILTPHLI
jgi:hypothetical protein